MAGGTIGREEMILLAKVHRFGIWVSCGRGGRVCIKEMALVRLAWSFMEGRSSKQYTDQIFALRI